CPKSNVATLSDQVRPSHLVTLLDPEDEMPTPEGVPGHRHLKLGMHDTVRPAPGQTPPDELHVRELLVFARDWSRSQPMLVHCWAGISRSTASAFAIACMVAPPGNELRIARLLRERAPHAHPNARIVAIADALLGRDGRMVDAIDAIGPGKVVFEGVPFLLPVQDT
ncbi:MAG: tyrosine phosphatase family protein, partial [Phycisphaerae bacterium]